MDTDDGKSTTQIPPSLDETSAEIETRVDEDCVFHFDRHKIQSVLQGPEELQSLGITIYDHDTFERGVLEQVDEALERQNRKTSSGEILEDTSDEKVNVSNNITCDSSCKTSETLLPKHCQNSCSSAENENLSQDNSSSLLFKALKRDHYETESQRKIRLGEMTPFGSVVDKKDISEEGDSLSFFNGYFQRQIMLQKRHESNELHQKGRDTKKIVNCSTSQMTNVKASQKTKSPLKISILSPSKLKKKEKMGCTVRAVKSVVGSPGKLLSEITPLDDSDIDGVDNYSDSDYKPDSSEEEMKLKKKTAKLRTVPVRMKRRKEKEFVPPEEWGTDDSDWESSDEEVKAKQRKSSKKEVDDGNVKSYEYRLKCWEMSKESDTLGDHTLSAGYKLPKSYWSKLYKFQRVGVQWLWELHQQACGGILGDEMGLGKTVQVISFLAGLSYSSLVSRHRCFRGLGPTLIVCPTTVLHQWVREFHTWWPQFRVAILHESGSFSGKRDILIQQISSKGGILIVSFVGVVQYCAQLVAKDWHYVILDEGHKIRNPDAQVTLAVKQFRTPHRLILSGSPMQNNLKELWSLFDFVFPGKLGTLPVFLAQFAVPITQGGYSNASEVQVATAFRCATVLKETISPFLLRRVKSDVKTHIHLPEKSEQVLFCKLTEEQREMYRAYLDSGEVTRILQGHAQIFLGLINLRKICNHPDLYSGGPKLFHGDKEEDLPEEQRYGHWRKSGKMIVIESLLKIWKKQGHKVLLFTQSRQMLCVLEAFVQKEGYSYLKLDGGTSVAARQPLIKTFNENPAYFVFLLTTRVGGLGVNLTGANRVVIYDPDWNPATDTQARERAWRIGQQNQVTVYRLVTAGTIEEKVYHRQIFKQFLTNKVLSDPKQRRFFKSNDLFELFTLKEGEQEGCTETSAIFAGTGSEVKLQKLKERMKRKKKELQIKMKSDITKIHTPSQDSVKFSNSKLEHMKKLAQRLSRVIGIKKEQSSGRGVCGNGKFRNRQHDANQTSLAAVFPVKVETVTSNDLEISRVVHDVVEELVCNAAREAEKDSTVCTAENSEGEGVQEDRFSLPLSTVLSQPPAVVRAALKAPKEPRDLVPEDGKDTPPKNFVERSHSKKHKHKKSKRRKKVYFEGNEVSHLVKMEQAKHTNESEGTKTQTEQDDYVLKKLFKKSGLQTVLKHDKIMEGGPADHALVEGEARRVAKEALQALRRSRQLCFTAEIGRPSWTGQSGTLRAPARPRFSQKKFKPGSQMEADPNKQRAMSSSDLLARMRQRHQSVQVTSSAAAADGEMATAAEEAAPAPPCSILSNQINPDDNVDLLRDIRNFVAFGATTNGRASTTEIVDKFRARLPVSNTPVFKFLLLEVCDFFRMPSGEGMWKLRAEFQW